MIVEQARVIFSNINFERQIDKGERECARVSDRAGDRYTNDTSFDKKSNFVFILVSKLERWLSKMRVGRPFYSGYGLHER